MEKKWNLTPTVPKTAKPIATKFGVSDEVGDPYLCAKIIIILIICGSSLFASCPGRSPARSGAYKMTPL